MKQYPITHLLVLALAVGSVGINSAPGGQGSLSLQNIQYLNAQVTQHPTCAKELLQSCHTIPFDPEYVTYARKLIYPEEQSYKNTSQLSEDIPSVALYPLYLRLVAAIASAHAMCRREAEQVKSEIPVQQ